MVDIFLRKDNFAGEPWYNEFCIFLAIGVCRPEEIHIAAVREALAQMGYETKLLRNKDTGKVYVVGGSENG